MIRLRLAGFEMIGDIASFSHLRITQSNLASDLMKEKAKRIRDAISANNHNEAEAILLQGLSEDPNRLVEMLREKGVFRTGRYGFNSDGVARLAEKTLAFSGAGLSSQARGYVESTLNLSALAPSVAAQLKKLRMFVNAGHFKTFLVAVELLFRRPHTKIYSERILTWHNYALEELAEGFSYYFSLLREKESISVLNINQLVAKRLDSGFCAEKLAAFASIVRFREAELMVEAFPYLATTSNLETTIQAASPEFEKAVRWGYISSEEQRNVDRQRWQTTEMPSLKELAVTVVDSLGDRIFEIIEGPVARVRVHFPLIEQFVAVFTQDTFLAEDVAFIRDAMKSLFVSYEQLRVTTIHNAISLIDVLKFRRVCVFLQAALDEFCKRKNLLTSPTYYRSLVAHFNEAEAANWVTTLTGVKDVKSLFELLCATDETSAVFDLQYTPVMRTAGQLLVPIGVVANCNIMRNALQRWRFRFDSGGKCDPLGDRIVTVCQEVGVSAKAKVKVRYNGSEAEADVLAVVDNHLFVFECKNSLHPCNSFELRQSYDYILKAVTQLDRFCKLYAEKAFRRIVSNIAGFDVTGCVGITTCIVTGNRMFNGYREAGHAVRNIHEFENVIVGGGISLVPFPKNPDEPNGAKIKVRVNAWGGVKISASDLVNYIEKDSWHVPAFNAMDFNDEVIPFGQKTLRFKSYMLDVGRYRELMRHHPQAVETELSS